MADQTSTTPKEIIEQVKEFLGELGYDDLGVYVVMPRTGTLVPIIEFLDQKIVIVPIKKNGSSS